MNFEESFFQSSSGSEDEKCTDAPREDTHERYIAKRCEPNVRERSCWRSKPAAPTFV